MPISCMLVSKMHVRQKWNKAGQKRNISAKTGTRASKNGTNTRKTNKHHMCADDRKRLKTAVLKADRIIYVRF